MDQSVDGMLAQLMGMGFSAEDAQMAVKNGKLSVEEAIEWILSGKPVSQTPAPANTVLHLNRQGAGGSDMVGSNPFNNPQPLTVPASSGTSGSTSYTPDFSTNPNNVVQSRLSHSEEQRISKKKFEDKQREETRKKLKQEKITAKKEKDAIMQEIAKDREMAKLKRVSGNSGHTTGACSASAAKGPSPEKGARASPENPNPTTHTKCMLQIRLPNGRALREQFTPETTLQEVWKYVGTNFQQIEEMCLMQPFPRREFGESDLHLTMQEMGLVPSGSLVLKKAENRAGAREPGDGSECPAPASSLERPQPAEPPTGQEDNQDMESNAETVETPSGAQFDVPSQLNPGLNTGAAAAFAGGNPLLGGSGMPPSWQPATASHSWGGGHRLGYDMVEDAQQEQQAMDAEEIPTEKEQEGIEEHEVEEEEEEMLEHEEEHEEDEEEDDEDMQQGAGAFGGGNPHAEPESFGHDWGLGHALAHNYIQASHLTHHHKSTREVAARAASERFAAPAAPVPGPSAPPKPTTATIIPTLANMLVQHVATRICDTRHPITGLQGLPADVAMRILHHLIREKLLKPRTLQPFVSCRLQRLVLDSYPYATNELLASIRLHTNLTHLSLAACPLITDRGLQYLRTLRRLRSLSLLNCRQVTDAFIQTLTELPSLCSVVLENTGVSDSGLASLASAAGTLRELQHINLNRTSITEAGLQHLTAFHNLHTLSIEGTQVADISVLHSFPQLQMLNISRTPLNTESISILQHLMRLTALNISNMAAVQGDAALQYCQGLSLQTLRLPDRLTTTDAGIRYIQSMPLHTLDLTNYTQVGSPGALYIGMMATIRKLHMSNTGLTDEGMNHLRGLVNMEELHVDRTHITDAAVDIIASFSNLQELSLSETRITNQCLYLRHINRCQMLSKLNLSRTSVTTRGVLYLSLPYLTLINLDATGVRQTEVEECLGNTCPRLKHVTMKHVTSVPAHEELMPL